MARTRDERYAPRLPAFAARLRELRAAAGLTQAQVAERAELDVSMVQNLERPSDGGNPRLTTLMALADAIGVPVTELVDFG